MAASRAADLDRGIANTCSAVSILVRKCCPPISSKVKLGLYTRASSTSVEMTKAPARFSKLLRTSSFSLRSLTRFTRYVPGGRVLRSEEHTSELQSLRHLVCRLL